MTMLITFVNSLKIMIIIVLTNALTNYCHHIITVNLKVRNSREGERKKTNKLGKGKREGERVREKRTVREIVREGERRKR